MKISCLINERIVPTAFECFGLLFYIQKLTPIINIPGKVLCIKLLKDFSERPRPTSELLFGLHLFDLPPLSPSPFNIFLTLDICDQKYK